VDTNTFVTTLYVMADDFCKALPPERRPGPSASLSRGEVVTLGVFGQWFNFGSERGFHRWAKRNLRSAFPGLPHRSQLNRLMRRYCDAIACFCLHFAELLDAARSAYESLDTCAVPSRDCKRRGGGWLPGLADIGWNNRLDSWYEGFHLLTSVTPVGVVTGFGVGSASAKDQPLADTFLALRAGGDGRLASVGRPANGAYVTDKGFEGEELHRAWLRLYGAEVICPNRRNAKNTWPKELRRWLASLRQIVETVHEKLLNTFRLSRERPHDVTGFLARLAAKMALHNFCIWLNIQLGRPKLAFADLVQW